MSEKLPAYSMAWQFKSVNSKKNIDEQCRGIFTADIYLKILEDNVLNNFDKYIFFSILSTDIFQKIRDNL